MSKSALVLPGVAAASAVVVVILVVVDRSEIDRLEAAFNDRECSQSGTPHRETLTSERKHDYIRMVARREDPRFARLVEQTDPELTVLSCQAAGPSVRYFDFALAEDAARAIEAHQSRGSCRIDDALIDGISRHVATYCQELDGVFAPSTDK